MTADANRDQPFTRVQKIVGGAGVVLLFMALFLPRFFPEAWIDFLVSAFGDAASVALILILASGNVAAVLAMRLYSVWSTPRRMIRIGPSFALYSIFVLMGAASTAGGSNREMLDAYVAQVAGPSSLPPILSLALLLFLGSILLASAVEALFTAKSFSVWLTLGVIGGFWGMVALMFLT